MSKAYYYFGYSPVDLDWAKTFIRAGACVVYLDSTLDSLVGGEKNRYILTTEKIADVDITYTADFITFQDAENVLLSSDIVYVKGFLMFRKKRALIERMINSDCDNDFNEASTKLGLDTWKYEFYHKKFLFSKMGRLVNRNILSTVYAIRRDHPMIVFFIDFVRSCFKIVNKRIFSIILVGDTKIGKSVCFKECLVASRYIEYHNNMLEFSKCTDENKRLFRLLDDINWNTVDTMTLKSILNRNVSTVDVKYSYGIIYPMINIFLMNKEDYAIFQRRYVDIWSFISNNVAIFPKQGSEITEETALLYNPETNYDRPLFSDILDMEQHQADFDAQLERGDHPNIYECVRSFLVDSQPYIYDNRQFIDLTSTDLAVLPNRQLIENEMIRKIKEVETAERYQEKVEHRPSEKKPKSNFDKRGCLDYYFNRRKSIQKPRAVPQNTADDYSDGESLSEKDMDNEIDSDMDSDIEGDDDEIMDDSFTC